MPSRGSTGRWLALVASIAAALLVGVAIAASGGGTTSAPAPSAAPPSRKARAFVQPPPRERAAVRGRSERAAPVETVAPVAPIAPTAPPADDTGTLDTPPAMWNHRIFIDGVARGVGGDSIRVHCGKHAIKLGSAGRVQSVDVPCGGTLFVER